jgi:hypothetical protein
MDQIRLAALRQWMTPRPSRRDVVRGLARAGLGLGIARLPDLVEAKKKRKRKNKHKHAKDPCQQQAQCAAAITAYCAQLPDPVLCEGIYLPCCEHFTECNVEAGIACIFVAD